jgi:hypothetical protein
MTNANTFSPLFHRPTFECSISEGLHLRDPSFGGVVLLVCAIGSRYVDDPRVKQPGESHASAGWRWFAQVDISRRDLFRPPRLNEIHTYLLAAMYGAGLFRGQLIWVLLGVAIRMIQEVGAHMKSLYKSTPNAQDEMWKRCFWYVQRSLPSLFGMTTVANLRPFRVLFNYDVGLASNNGRPPGWSENECVRFFSARLRPQLSL